MNEDTVPENPIAAPRIVGTKSTNSGLRAMAPDSADNGEHDPTSFVEVGPHAPGFEDVWKSQARKYEKGEQAPSR